MTESDKAKELIQKFNDLDWDKDECPNDFSHDAKQCALIAVDEIIQSQPKLVAVDGMGSARFNNPNIKYWIKVKEAITTL